MAQIQQKPLQTMSNLPTYNVPGMDSLPNAPIPNEQSPQVRPSFMRRLGQAINPMEGRPSQPFTRPDKLRNWLTIGDLATRGLDAYSTDRMLNQGDKELYLPNAIATHPAAMTAYSEGIGLGNAMLSKYLDNHGHPTLAKLVPAIDMAYDLPLAIKNFTLPNYRRNQASQPTGRPIIRSPRTSGK